MAQPDLFTPPPAPPLSPTAMLGRWRVTPAALAALRAELDGYKRKADDERAARAAALARDPRQLAFEFDDDGHACAICEDQLEVDCGKCDGAGCAACDESGMQPCACQGGPDELDELDEDPSDEV